MEVELVFFVFSENKFLKSQGSYNFLVSNLFALKWKINSSRRGDPGPVQALGAAGRVLEGAGWRQSREVIREARMA